MEHPISAKINILSNSIRREVDNFVSSEIGDIMDNVTITNGRVIGYLSLNSDKDIFQKDIEDLLQLRRSTVSTLLQGMEAKGFIVREAVSYDARVKKIVLTDKAITIHSRIKKTIMGFECRLISGISEEDLNIFLNVLEKMQDNLN